MADQRANSSPKPDYTLACSEQPSMVPTQDENSVTPLRDYEWEVYQMGIAPDQDLWETLEADPEATHDGMYGDDSEDDEDGNDSNDDSRDTCLQLGKMIVTERLGGLFRPQYTNEVGFNALDSNPIILHVLFAIYKVDQRSMLTFCTDSLGIFSCQEIILLLPNLIKENIHRQHP
jgi:hypothetical protein